MTKTKNEQTADLARRAFEASGLTVHEDFCALFGGAMKLRSFRGWLAGETPPSAMAQLLLREFIAGWRPTQIEGKPS